MLHPTCTSDIKRVVKISESSLICSEEKEGSDDIFETAKLYGVDNRMEITIATSHFDIKFESIGDFKEQNEILNEKISTFENR